MGATAKAGGNLYRESRQALRSFCPQAVLNWREARFYARYGEVELHLLEFLCRRDQDAIDVGANDGSYVHYLRPPRATGRRLRTDAGFRWYVAPQVPTRCRRPGPGAVGHRRHGQAPHTDRRRRGGGGLLDHLVGRISRLSGHRTVEVPMNRLDSIYRRRCGFHQRSTSRATSRPCSTAPWRQSSGAGRACWSNWKSACRRADSSTRQGLFRGTRLLRLLRPPRTPRPDRPYSRPPCCKSRATCPT